MKLLAFTDTHGSLSSLKKVAEKIKKILRDKNGVVTDEDREEIKKELG